MSQSKINVERRLEKRVGMAQPTFITHGYSLHMPQFYTIYHKTEDIFQPDDELSFNERLMVEAGGTALLRTVKACQARPSHLTFLQLVADYREVAEHETTVMWLGDG